MLPKFYEVLIFFKLYFYVFFNFFNVLILIINLKNKKHIILMYFQETKHFKKNIFTIFLNKLKSSCSFIYLNKKFICSNHSVRILI